MEIECDECLGLGEIQVGPEENAPFKDCKKCCGTGKLYTEAEES